jgi:hypothetical protein
MKTTHTNATTPKNNASPTSVAAAIADHSSINKNPRVVVPAAVDHNSSCGGGSGSDNLGRNVYYRPKVVYMPVKASCRLFSAPGQQDATQQQGKQQHHHNHHLTKRGVDELNEKLASLLIQGAGEEEDKEEGGTTTNGGGAGRNKRRATAATIAATNAVKANTNANAIPSLGHGGIAGGFASAPKKPYAAADHHQQQAAAAAVMTTTMGRVNRTVVDPTTRKAVNVTRCARFFPSSADE